LCGCVWCFAQALALLELWKSLESIAHPDIYLCIKHTLQLMTTDMFPCVSLLAHAVQTSNPKTRYDLASGWSIPNYINADECP
jgi:hypothetical protein